MFAAPCVCCGCRGCFPHAVQKSLYTGCVQESDVFLKKSCCSRNGFNGHFFSHLHNARALHSEFLLLSTSSGHGLLSVDEATVGDTSRKQLIGIKSVVVRSIFI